MQWPWRNAIDVLSGPVLAGSTPTISLPCGSIFLLAGSDHDIGGNEAIEAGSNECLSRDERIFLRECFRVCELRNLVSAPEDLFCVEPMHLHQAYLFGIELDVGRHVSAIVRVHAPRQEDGLEFILPGFGFTPQLAEVIEAVCRGFQDHFRAWKVRHGLHQCRHLNWQIGPKRNLRTMQELCCSRAPGALVRCDGNEISAIDLVEDKLVRVRNAGRRLKVGR